MEGGNRDDPLTLNRNMDQRTGVAKRNSVKEPFSSFFLNEFNGTFLYCKLNLSNLYFVFDIYISKPNSIDVVFYSLGLALLGHALHKRSLGRMKTDITKRPSHRDYGTVKA